MAKQDEDVGRLAHAEAVALADEYVGTHHLLLAVANQPGTVATEALTSNGVHLKQLRAVLASMVQPAEGEVRGRRPWTPRAKRVIEFAAEEAKAKGHGYVGPEHVLLGVLRDEDGAGFQAVRALNADPVAIRRTVVEGLEQV
jgi:ATP-dependent Clp protease ATP-binding subunit ClpC